MSILVHPGAGLPSGIKERLTAVEKKNEEQDEAIDGKAPQYEYSSEDLTAGVSPLETGKLYFVYE